MILLLKHIGLSVCSAFLLSLAFPKTGWWPLAWISFIPLLYVLDQCKTKRSAFGFGYLFGLVFFWMTLYWIKFVTLPGTALLMCYLAIYPAVFSLSYLVTVRDGQDARSGRMLGYLYLSAVWTIFEYIRAHLFSGFGWAALSHSQYKNLPFIQIADITGEYGVSFVVMLINLLVWKIVGGGLGVAQRRAGTHASPRLRRAMASLVPAVFILIFVLFSVYTYGFYRINQPLSSTQSMNVGLVQANIPLEIRWDRFYRPSIVQKHLSLSEKLIPESPELIVWSETSFPGIIWEEPILFDRIRTTAAEWETSMLIGVVTGINDNFYNSAVLIDEQGNMADQYNKIHLVPFGEFIPFREIFPILEEFVPIDDFTAGKQYKVFDMNGRKFSVLICFEDTVPHLSRHMINAGAQMLINMSNDAWFRDTREPYLHLAASVFRSVENRVAQVRVSNTGISGLIDPKGRIRAVVNPDDSTWTVGIKTVKPGFYNINTIYKKYGNIFTFICFASILIAIGIAFFNKEISHGIK